MGFNSAYFHFENPASLVLLLLALLFIVFDIFPGKKVGFSIKKLRKFIDEHLIEHLLVGDKSKKKQRLKAILISTIFALFVLSLSNPRWGFTEVDSYKPNVNLVMLVDLSRSMNANDEKPSRLARVKQEIKDIIDNVEGVNIGIVGFANNAHVISPISSDKNALEYLLPSINTDLIAVQGSNIKVALNAANNLFKTSEGGINYVLLMSDGDFERPVRKNQFDKVLKEGEIISYSFGKAEGAPMKQEDGSYYKYGGKIIITKLGEQNLRNISGDDYFIKSSYLDDDLNKLKAIIESKKTAENAKYQTIIIWHDRFYIPLIIAMILLIPLFRKGAFFPVIVAVLIFNLASTKDAFAQEKEDTAGEIQSIAENLTSGDIFRNEDQKAVKAFEENNYEAAYDKFSSSYNKGVAAFRQQNFEDAEKQFSASGETIDAKYNLGNSQLMQMKLEEAIKNYEKVLADDEGHVEAKHNLEIAKKLLENQKNQENKQDKNKQDNEKNQQDKNQNKQDKGQQNQDKDDQSGNQDEQQDNNGGKGDKDKEQKDEGGDKEQEGEDQGEKDKGKGQDEEEGKKDQSDDKGDKKGKGNGEGDNNESSQNEQQNQKGDSAGGDEDGQGGDKQNSGKSISPELDKKAKMMFDKIKGDPEDFMKNRFKHDEKSKNKLLTPDDMPRPW